MKIDILSLGAVILLADLGVLLKVASLRGDIYSKWQQRVFLAEAGLSEKAAEELRHLKVQIDRIVGTRAQFDPTRVVTEPADLLANVLRFKRLIETRERLQGQFRQLRNLGPVLVFTSLAFAVGIVLMFAHYGELTSNTFVRDAGTVLCVIFGAVAVVCCGIYIYLQHCLSGAEILSDSESSGD